MSAPAPPYPPPTPEPNFVSRGGLKLRHALDAFAIDATDLTAVDLGCSTGGFTDCLLQAGAARVFAIDTAYGELAWKLRNNPRVVVMERTNALHAAPKSDADRVDLAVADLSWTPQRLLIPAALKWLKPGGRIITLIKPHYELKDRNPKAVPRGGVLDEPTALRVLDETLVLLPTLGVRVLGVTKSPVLGGSKGKGNAEWLVVITQA
jgi:23S rRNA (cytidine1920-2'-O)/16S rRNA (cytidine1409-2'-O)-methyltransferase